MGMKLDYSRVKQRNDEQGKHAAVGLVWSVLPEWQSQGRHSSALYCLCAHLLATQNLVEDLVNSYHQHENRTKSTKIYTYITNN